MIEGKTPQNQNIFVSVAVQTRDTGVITGSWSTYWSMIDMANGIRRAFQSLFLLVALLSVFSGMCFDTFVLECDRPFYCKVKVASQTAHCDGVNGGWQGCLAWFWEYSRFASIRLLQKNLFFVIREFLSPAISEDLKWNVRNILRLISTEEPMSREIFTVIKPFKDLKKPPTFVCLYGWIP